MARESSDWSTHWPSLWRRALVSAYDNGWHGVSLCSWPRRPDGRTHEGAPTPEDALLARCLFCRLPFPPNDTVEAFPRGRRLAFDPQRGRLWAICGGCGRWSLAPIESRWEALEELERLTVDRGRLLAETGRIALFRAGEMDVVRVGRAGLEEEAWWRYGTQMRKRRRLYSAGALVGKALRVGMLITSGPVYFLFTPKDAANRLLRYGRFGRTAWKGEVRCARCGGIRRRIRYAEADSLLFGPNPHGEGLALGARCERCARGVLTRLTTPRESFHEHAPRGHLITGVEAQQTLRRLMAHRNFAGATERQVHDAIGFIDQAGSPEGAVQRLAQRDRRLAATVGGKEGAVPAVALEIALNDEAERRLLEMEVKALEARWKEEEELAAIVDGELTLVPARLWARLRKQE